MSISEKPGPLGTAVYLWHGESAQADERWQFQHHNCRLWEWRHGRGAGTKREQCAKVCERNSISHVKWLILKSSNVTCVYFFLLKDMSIWGGKGTLSAQQDCRSEWTLLRLEKQIHRDKTAICELAGKKKPLIEGQPLTMTTWPLLTDGQTERTLMHNEYITARPVCHRLWISPLSPCLLLLPFVLSRRAQPWAMGNRLDS